jgi:hypothetical protein
MANTLPGKYQRLESDLSMKTKTHFAFRLDIWDADANTYRRACCRRGRLRGGRSDLPGRRGALARGAHYPAAGRADRA